MRNGRPAVKWISLALTVLACLGSTSLTPQANAQSVSDTNPIQVCVLGTIEIGSVSRERNSVLVSDATTPMTRVFICDQTTLLNGVLVSKCVVVSSDAIVRDAVLVSDGVLVSDEGLSTDSLFKIITAQMNEPASRILFVDCLSKPIPPLGQ